MYVCVHIGDIKCMYVYVYKYMKAIIFYKLSPTYSS